MAFEMASLLFTLSFVIFIAGHVTASRNEWRRIGRPLPNEKVTVTIALRQTNTEWLKTTLQSVSDPGSSRYGHHLTIDQIVEHVHAHPEGVAEVKKVLGAMGLVPDFTLGNGFAVVKMPVVVAERLFSAKFHRYQHHDRKHVLLCSLHYSIPPTLVPHVSFISGISHFPKITSPQKSKGSDHDLGDVTPKVIETSYNINGYASTNKENSQAIAGFLGQYFSPEDLTEFQQEYKLPQNPITKVIGENNGDNQGIEANLDVQYITAIGRNVDTWFISVTTRANGNQEDFVTWVLELVNDTSSPWVHSVSYGDYESSIDPGFMARVDEEFMKLGISGRTLLFASGDSGTACSLTKGGKFEPMWPASSPYVTTVGGTVSMTECWDHSGGGFSNVYATPSYQTDAVGTYLKSGAAPGTKYFNPSGRAYPDLAAFSINYLIVYISIPWPVDGTSCATPTTAGIISLLNDVRLNAGNSTLGFVNPLLYQLSGNGFFDVTEGSNHGRAWCRGFKAAQGWDPTTGWGSPNFGMLKQLIS